MWDLNSSIVPSSVMRPIALAPPDHEPERAADANNDAAD